MSALYSVDLIVNDTALPKRQIGEHCYVEVPSAPADFSVQVTNHTSTTVGFWMWVDGVESPVWRYVNTGYHKVNGFEVSDTKYQQFRFAKPTVRRQPPGSNADDGRSADGGQIGCIEVVFWPLEKVEPYDVTLDKKHYSHAKHLAAPSLDQCSSGDMMLKVASELGEFKARKPTTGLKWELNDSEGEPILKTKLFYRSRAQLDVLEDLHDSDRQTDRQTKWRRVSDGAKVVIDLT